MKLDDIDIFTRHYLIAALWSSTDDYGNPLDAFYNLEDCAPDFIAKAFEDCQKFQMANRDNLAVAYEMYNELGYSYHPDCGSPESCGGHDFWLTRAGTGAGFGDRNFGLLGDMLTKAAKVFPEVTLYADSDGLLHQE